MHIVLFYFGCCTSYYNLQSTLQWKGRQLTQYQNAQEYAYYGYNADGVRVRKIDKNGQYTRYFVDGTTLLAVKTSSYMMWFIYDSNGEIVGFTYNDTPYYYLKNIQGDVYKIVDANGTVVGSYAYDPWGVPLSIYGSMAQINPIRYRSYYYDNESGFYYLNSRYYDPNTGRFLNADAFVSTGQGILGHNMFAYCGNNPIIYADPSGFKLVLAPDATDEQKEEYERATAYLKNSKTASLLITFLETSPQVITVAFIDGENNMYYDPNNHTIYFDTNLGLIVGDGTSVMSPALALAHEMGHAFQHLAGIQFTEDNRFMIESSNLSVFETPIAKELGEPIRNNYFDTKGVMDMQNSTHFRTTRNRHWLLYIFPWNWGKPQREIIDHNV